MKTTRTADLGTRGIREGLRFTSVGRRVAAIFVAVAFLLLAGGSGIAGGQGLRHAPAITIYAGPNLKGPLPGVSPQSGALAFFPSSVTIRAGQSVTWQFRGFHTATFPGANANPPFVTPHPEAPQPTVNDVAGLPFWWVGKAPSLQIDPFALMPQGGATISSRADVRSSGLARIVTAPANAAPAPYTLKFLKPGSYHFLCLVHPGMRGTIRVLAAKTKAKTATPASVAKQTAAQLAGIVGQLKQLDQTKPAGPLEVSIGAGANSGAEITSFYPKQLSVKVGDTVTFIQNDATDVHTVTFGPEPYTTAIEKGLVQPVGSPPVIVLNPLGALPSEPPGSPSPVPYDGTNHGNGYLNSGILAPPQVPGQPHQFAVTFTKPGTFRFECVIHANMDATVVVQ